MIAIVLMYISNYSYFKFIFRASSAEVAIASSAGVYMSTGEYIINILASIFMTIALITTIISGWSYLKNAKDLLKSK